MGLGKFQCRYFANTPMEVVSKNNSGLVAQVIVTFVNGVSTANTIAS